jgi:TonB-linked SusC/RagA family outer membrane protein
MKHCLPGHLTTVVGHNTVRRKIPKLRLLLFLFSSIVFAVTGLAQQKTVTGTVTSQETKLPLAGVSVTVSGTQRGTQTDNSGRFTISAAEGSTLVFSFVGFRDQEVKTGSQNNLSITLAPGSNGLAEVIVIGYGTQRRKDLTGAVSTVTSKDFQKGVITTPEQLIAGKVAGVSVISNSGAPGAGSTIRIRGGSSLRASNDPLIVVDGVPLDNTGVSGSPNSLSMINSNDIESFTILKDASAAAIYGTRASNGVILITTKKGMGGKLRVNFSTVNSISTLVKKVDVLSPDQFRSVVNTYGTTAQKAMLGTANTDWQNEIYSSAFTSDNNISFSGGITGLPYRVSIGFLNQDGILKTGYMRRVSAALVLNPNFFDNHLKLDLNIKATTQETRFATQGAIGGAISFNPTQPVYSNSPRFGGYFEYLDPATATGLTNLAGRNPVGMLNQRVDKGTPMRSIGNLQLDYKFHFLPELRANLNLGYDVSKGSGTVYVSDSAASDYLAGGTGGQNNQYKQEKSNTILEAYLNYAKDIASIHSRIDIMGGYSYNNYQTTNYNYASYNAKGVKYPNTDPNFPFNKPENTLISYFGRLNYSYKDRYLLTATVRRDGSSRFAEANRWAVFPSVAFAWNMKEDLFSKNNTFSSLKLRIGYGVTGQQDGIGNYDYLSTYALSANNATYQFGNAFFQMYRPSGYNPNIKWEQTATTNLAVDFGFLDNRINGSIDIYQKKTTDLLNSIPQPAGTNFSAFIIANVGDMENKGVEFNINAQVLRRKEFTWEASYNVTYNKNTITNLTVLPKDVNYVGFPSGSIAGGIGGQFVFINSVDYSKNTFFLYKQVYDKAGKPVEGVFEDLNKDGIINQNDLYRSKRADPQVFMGFSSNFSYKKWSAGFVLRAAFDNYVYNNNYSQTGTRNQILGNASVLYNASTSYLETNFIGNSLELLSDYYIQNASFLRMDNLNIGYNAGSIFKNKATLRLSAGVQNVFVLTNYKGLDPELSGGIDNNVYPRPRIYSLGINLDF